MIEKKNNVKDPLFTIAGICGSEKQNGNTEQILEYVGQMIKNRNGNFIPIHLREHHINPCGSCGDCNVLPYQCKIDDNMSSIIDIMTKADGIIYAVPVHGFGMAHPMQIFIERAGVCYLRFKRPLANKVGGIIVTGRRYHHSQVFHQLISNLLLNRMIVIGSGYPPFVFGGRPGKVFEDKEGMMAVRQMINRMIDMTLLLKNYQKNIGDIPLSLLDENERMGV